MTCWNACQAACCSSFFSSTWPSIDFTLWADNLLVPSKKLYMTSMCTPMIYGGSKQAAVRDLTVFYRHKLSQSVHSFFVTLDVFSHLRHNWLSIGYLSDGCMCYCSSWSTSLFVIGHVSTQLSWHLLGGRFLPLMRTSGKMEWNLMISATESNIWGDTRRTVNMMLTMGEKVVWLSTHIIRPLPVSQRELARALDEADFYIVNLLVVVNGQHQGFAGGADGAVPHQKRSVLT